MLQMFPDDDIRETIINYADGAGEENTVRTLNSVGIQHTRVVEQWKKQCQNGIEQNYDYNLVGLGTQTQTQNKNQFGFRFKI